MDDSTLIFEDESFVVKYAPLGHTAKGSADNNLSRPTLPCLKLYLSRSAFHPDRFEIRDGSGKTVRSLLLPRSGIVLTVEKKHKGPYTTPDEDVAISQAIKAYNLGLFETLMTGRW